MAIFKCKMCGGDLNVTEDIKIIECDYCGTNQTVPAADNEKKISLFNRANRLRMSNDFDKAAGIYESIITEFPEESEAYWGLVLCKYGIEYVDDPASGKKIPTCHRSSYNSVLDDSDFEQAVENADVVAQKMYRDEAKQIEKIRKGIMEVSSKEKPYDIFICYKETTPDGDRTLDSVLAQDLYSALTDKGYRVFFSRITLQDKLGEAYEPYIFAALNSAKVMLAVGTSYEYYNAVWVKNEWSRYLKICEADKSKHLIPCYKNLDPEDMPKEFNHLQGADLSKMGAVQDILFNMEKYIPLKKETTTVVQEKIVVGGSGGNNIASLLDRGNMALEDGDWNKADSFFEDVLNNDSQNAQAYLGKALAAARCRTVDAFIRKRNEASQKARTEIKQILPDSAHVKQIVEKYVVPNYLDDVTLYQMYNFDLSYSSAVSCRREQYEAEDKNWVNNKLLSKAVKFADGALAEQLQKEKENQLSVLSQRIKSAETEENAAMKAVEQRYEEYLKQTDERAEKMYNDALERREKDYQSQLQIAENSSNVAMLNAAAIKFKRLDDYRDSKKMAEFCDKRAAEEQVKLDAEAMHQKEIAEKAAAEKKKKLKLVLCIVAAIAALGFVVYVIAITVLIPNAKYNNAVELMESGKYVKAIEAFKEVRDFKDAKEQICKIYLAQGVQEMESGNYEDALELFEDAAESVDVTNEQDQCYYKMALDKVSKGYSGSEWLTKIRNSDAFPDYNNLKLLCEAFDTMKSVTDNGLENRPEITEFETTLKNMKELIAKLNTDVKLPDSYAAFSKNIGYYGKYLTETGEYTTLLSDGGGGGYASLSIDEYGLKIFGIGPGCHLENGAMSITKDGGNYSADSYIYTLLEDGHVVVLESERGNIKEHEIIPEK